MRFRYSLLLLFSMQVFAVHAQQHDAAPDTMDVADVLSSLRRNAESAPKKKPSPLAILPAIGYNPTFGLMLGATVTGGFRLGNDPETRLSNAIATVFYTTNNIANLQIRHNIFTPGNDWVFQGNFQAARMIWEDYGLGTGGGTYRNDPEESPEIEYPIRFGLFRLNQKLYREIGPSLYIGGGINFDVARSIKDTKLNIDSGQLTPHYNYSIERGIDPTVYWANGLMFNIQYNTRDHPNRSYSGIYADLVWRENANWLGSTKRASQLITEFRKYFSLSKVNPETVLAFWYLGTFQISGTVPYLHLPATGSDLYNRSGRAYTIGRFRGPSYMYLETEYRFPITRNKFLSGVVFLNVQTASDGKSVGLMEAFEPAGGAGLRILFKKNVRTNLCIDYAFGKYGAKGLFFGLTEAF